MAGLNGKTGEVIRWLIGLMAAVTVAYFTAQNATNERLTKVETQGHERWEMVKSSLDRIENRLEERDREQRALYNDWLNGVNRRTLEPLPLQSQIEREK